MSDPKADYQEILRQATVTLMRLQRPRRLLKIITAFVDRELSLSHTSILSLDETRKHFIFNDSKGRKRFPVGLLKFEMTHPFLRWFNRKGGEQRIYDDYLTLDYAKKWFSEAKAESASGELGKQRKKLEEALRVFDAELVVPAYQRKTLIALLLFGKKINGDGFSRPEISLFQTIAHTCAMAIQAAQNHETITRKNLELKRQLKENSRLRKKETETYRQILRSLAQEVHEKDPYTYGHITQVERLGMMTAQELGLNFSEGQNEVLSGALILHDIGKIGIPDKILNKPSRLDVDEWKIMQTHVVKGVRILEHLELFKEVAQIIHCHHERFDGTGYPRGLKGNEIPIEAKIISVVDAFHAIVSKRVYDAARPVEEAFRELQQAAGTQFDPEVVSGFIRAQKREMARRGVAADLEKPHEGAA